MSWAATEFESRDLGDPRRSRRAIRLMETLSAKPTASISGAWGDWADTNGAYRFFRNHKVQWSAVLAPHIQNSITRMATHEVVLCHLSYEAQRGMHAHPTYAVSTSREPMVVIDAWMWSRELKESARWIEGYRNSRACAQNPAGVPGIMASMVRARDLRTPVD